MVFEPIAKGLDRAFDWSWEKSKQWYDENDRGIIKSFKIAALLAYWFPFFFTWGIIGSIFLVVAWLCLPKERLVELDEA